MPDIKEKLKKLFTRKNKEEKTSTPAPAPKEPKIVEIKKNLKGEEQSEPLTKEQQEMVIKGAANMVESSKLDVAPAIKKLKEKLKGDQPMMIPSIRNYSESDLEKAVKAQFKNADEKNEEIKKGGITKEELKRRGITVKQQ